jgi:hypothetical protein
VGRGDTFRIEIGSGRRAVKAIRHLEKSLAEDGQLMAYQ